MFKTILTWLPWGLLGLVFGVIIIVYPEIQRRQVLPPSTIQSFTAKDFINMTEGDFNRIKEQEIMKMITDTAKAYGIKPYTFCGLSWHESAKFKYFNQRIKDNNGRWSYGLFMVQLETAILYDSVATESKLYTPNYNTHIAAVIFKHNLTKYGSYEMAIAAHNAGTIYDKKITNVDFVKKVYTATGEVYAAYDL